jgi:CNT family concentrative nucleoside transporter
MPSNLIGILGIIVILAIAVAFSSNRKAIHLRVVAAAFVLQAVIAAFVLYFDWGRRAINWLSFGVLAVIRYSKAGIDMVFGPLADTDVVGFSFAINVLPIIIFFAALMSVLYHLRIMEWLVRIVGGALHKIIGTGATSRDSPMRSSSPSWSRDSHPSPVRCLRVTCSWAPN